MLFKEIITEESIVLDLINSCISKHNRLLLTYINQHCFNIYSTNQNYKDLIDNKFTIYADGIGMNLINRILFNRRYKQFNATDLNEKIFNRLIETKIRFYILGGNFEEKKIKDKFNSNENYVGYSSGFFTETEFERISNTINNLKPEVIIVGMGVPKQEIITEKLSQIIDASLFLCVGNFFEFYFGTMKRIPNRFRDKGIEWIYRIFEEPKRLWKRYILGIPLFILRVLKYKLSKHLL